MNSLLICRYLRFPRFPSIPRIPRIPRFPRFPRFPRYPRLSLSRRFARFARIPDSIFTTSQAICVTSIAVCVPCLQRTFPPYSTASLVHFKVTISHDILLCPFYFYFSNFFFCFESFLSSSHFIIFIYLKYISYCLFSLQTTSFFFEILYFYNFYKNRNKNFNINFRKSLY